MKRKAFIQMLQQNGCVLLRHGSNHDIYINPKTNQKQPIPRHSEIDDVLVAHIKKYLSL